MTVSVRVTPLGTRAAKHLTSFCVMRSRRGVCVTIAAFATCVVFTATAVKNPKNFLRAVAALPKPLYRRYAPGIHQVMSMTRKGTILQPGSGQDSLSLSH